MNKTRRISVSLPDTLLNQINCEIESAHLSRSEFIREGLEYYMLERQRDSFRLQMAAGYKAMGALNLELAEERDSDKALCEYERALAEGE